jgi:hypothetical protein
VINTDSLTLSVLVNIPTREWMRQKSSTKETITPEFILEWFPNSLLPYISKDVVTSRVFMDEQVIFIEQQLESFYSQSRILYEIIIYAP